MEGGEGGLPIVGIVDKILDDQSDRYQTNKFSDIQTDVL